MIDVNKPAEERVEDGLIYDQDELAEMLANAMRLAAMLEALSRRFLLPLALQVQATVAGLVDEVKAQTTEEEFGHIQDIAGGEVFGYPDGPEQHLDEPEMPEATHSGSGLVQ